jgi:hypothetical protein
MEIKTCVNETKNDKENNLATSLIVIGVIVVLITICCVAFRYMKKKKNSKAASSTAKVVPNTQPFMPSSYVPNPGSVNYAPPNNNTYANQIPASAPQGMPSNFNPGYGQPNQQTFTAPNIHMAPSNAFNYAPNTQPFIPSNSNPGMQQAQPVAQPYMQSNQFGSVAPFGGSHMNPHQTQSNIPFSPSPSYPSPPPTYPQGSSTFHQHQSQSPSYSDHQQVNRPGDSQENKSDR